MEILNKSRFIFCGISINEKRICQGFEKMICGIDLEMDL